jgi:hypothetical protein
MDLRTAAASEMRPYLRTEIYAIQRNGKDSLDRGIHPSCPAVIKFVDLGEEPALFVGAGKRDAKTRAAT